MRRYITRPGWLTVGLFSAALALAAGLPPALVAEAQEKPARQGFSFRTAVDLVSVTATVTDDEGHFVRGLRAEDFVIYEDGKLQTISQFDAERVPVSLGIALDTSGSMVGEKMSAAQEALSRFVFDLLGTRDEMFLYRFDSRPMLVHGWTEDRRALVRALGSVRPSGGTALYDAVAESVPLAAAGSRRKKALVIISDGNDTGSVVPLREVRQLIRQSEVLVYAIGIDALGGSRYSSPAPRTLPIPIPGLPPIRIPLPGRQPPSLPPARTPRGGADERVNADALRMITDDSGGRTEIIASPGDLDPATTGIADELSQQYFLGYVSTLPKDGRWHSIEVRLRRGGHTVRARKGYTAG